ncbi:heavy-metal-associated domain-containing protein [Ideonella sp. DXS22W]|uniref:Heavy-metal-associated domain-containing protein n=1 Tax=Pseudaquabacterium inlustre TaxID=2984192 RepID=A0ABU9CHH1_9BURK
MTTFQIPDMSCGHCVGAITRAVQALDAGAELAFDLPNHRLTVQHGRASAAAMAEAITEAGYTPTEQAAPAAAAPASPRPGGCCGGSRACHT